MLRVFSEGDDVFRLEDAAGTHIGIIRGRAIRFGGFSSETAARDAAIDGWRAMNDALRREYPSWPHYELARERLRTAFDGAYEWFYDGKTAIARLLRPAPVTRDGTFAIELVLPSYTSEGVAIAASHGIWRAVAPYRDAASDEAPSRPKTPRSSAPAEPLAASSAA